MVIKKVTDADFRRYGRVMEGYDMTALLAKMEETSCPSDAVIYEPSVAELEALPIFQELSDRAYGGMPIQIGYCNGFNKKLNACEYHRDSELDIAVGKGLVLLLGKLEDVEPDFTYDTSKIEAFYLPAGVGVELFATTLHYAPCAAEGEDGFRCVVVLPRETNFPLVAGPWAEGEGRLITHKNKWLIAHEEAGIEGAFVGLKGANITIG